MDGCALRLLRPGWRLGDADDLAGVRGDGPDVGHSHVVSAGALYVGRGQQEVLHLDFR